MRYWFYVLGLTCITGTWFVDGFTPEWFGLMISGWLFIGISSILFTVEKIAKGE